MMTINYKTLTISKKAYRTRREFQAKTTLTMIAILYRVTKWIERKEMRNLTS